MRLLIRVTATDIAKGCKSNGNNCPIARALYRRMRRPFMPYVGSQMRFHVPGNEPLFAIEHTPQTREFIGNFDSHSAERQKLAKPFDFLLDVPSKWAFMFKR